jgi:hypothetical protein
MKHARPTHEISPALVQGSSCHPALEGRHRLCVKKRLHLSPHPLHRRLRRTPQQPIAGSAEERCSQGLAGNGMQASVPAKSRISLLPTCAVVPKPCVRRTLPHCSHASRNLLFRKKWMSATRADLAHLQRLLQPQSKLAGKEDRSEASFSECSRQET